MATVGIVQAASGERLQRERSTSLEVLPLANAAATVAVAAYLICAAVSIVAPDLLI